MKTESKAALTSFDSGSSASGDVKTKSNAPTERFDTASTANGTDSNTNVPEVFQSPRIADRKSQGFYQSPKSSIAIVIFSLIPVFVGFFTSKTMSPLAALLPFVSAL